MKLCMYISAFIFMAATVAFYAEAQYPTCASIKPLPPIDCENPVAVCSCGVYGCRWVWICGAQP